MLVLAMEFPRGARCVEAAGQSARGSTSEEAIDTTEAATEQSRSLKTEQ